MSLSIKAMNLKMIHLDLQTYIQLGIGLIQLNLNNKLYFIYDI